MYSAESRDQMVCMICLKFNWTSIFSLTILHVQSLVYIFEMLYYLIALINFVSMLHKIITVIQTNNCSGLAKFELNFHFGPLKLQIY